MPLFPGDRETRPENQRNLDRYVDPSDSTLQQAYDRIEYLGNIGATPTDEQFNDIWRVTNDTDDTLTYDQKVEILNRVVAEMWAAISARSVFLDHLHQNPILDKAFCDWLQRVNAGYVRVLEQLKEDPDSVDAQSIEALLSDFKLFLNLAK